MHHKSAETIVFLIESSAETYYNKGGIVVVVLTPRSVDKMGKKNQIPAAAHKLMRSFKPAPYNEVSKHLDEATKATLQLVKDLDDKRASVRTGGAKNG